MKHRGCNIVCNFGTGGHIETVQFLNTFSNEESLSFLSGWRRYVETQTDGERIATLSKIEI